MTDRTWEQWNKPDVVTGLAKEFDTEPVSASVEELRRIRDQYGARSMLDVGCGTGRFYTHAKALGYSYTGVDVTPLMVEHCRKRYPDGDFRAGDIYDLDFKDGEFDLVFCHDVIVHIPSVADALQELYRVSNAIVFLRIPYVWNLEERVMKSPDGSVSTTFNFSDIFGVQFLMGAARVEVSTIAIGDITEATSKNDVRQLYTCVKYRGERPKYGVHIYRGE